MKMKKPHEGKWHADRKKANNPTHQNKGSKQILDQEENSTIIVLIKAKISNVLNKLKDTNIKENIKEKVSFARVRETIANSKLDIFRSKAFILSCIFLVAILATYGIGQQVKQAQIDQQQFLEDNKTYKVFVDESYIGNLSDTHILEGYINRQLTQLMNHWDLDVRLKNQVTYEVDYEMVRDAEDRVILEIAEELLEFQTRSVMLYVNDVPVVRVASEKDAEEIIEQVTHAYVSNSENSKVKVAVILDRVDYKVEWAEASEIRDLDSATAILLRGSDKEIKHVVASGENIGVIAQKNKVTVSEIVEANPQLNSQSDLIHPGDQLSLVVPEPYVHVEVIEEVSETKSIPFETRNVNNSSMYTWETRVETRGQAGEKEVVYQITKLNDKEVERVVLQETIIKEPVEQVVAKGTIGVPSNGSGTLAWPTSSGRVTSMFGGSRRHSGVDIGNPTGTAVYAADNGTVVFAGWSGGYGNLIRITHTSTMQTYYAHLSSVDVRAGQTVKKGEFIGRVGSTGQSTGPHLHFEVRINGSAVNPMNYYGSAR